MTPLFNHNRGEPRERLWAPAFVLTWLASLIFGYAAISSSSNSHVARDLSEESVTAFLSLLVITYPLFLLICLAGARLLLRLLESDALLITRIAVGLMAATCILLALFCFFFGVVLSWEDADKAAWGGCLALVCALLALMWLGRRRIQQAGQLLGVAARTLRENPALVDFMVVLSLVSFLAVGGPLLLTFMAATGGEEVRYDTPNAWCFISVTPWNWGEQSCYVLRWQHWGAVLLLALSTLWALGLLVQLMVFVTAGVLGQWHIDSGHSSPPSSPPSSSPAVDGHSTRGAGQHGINVQQQSKRRLWVSLRHALSPSCSLGALALCSFPLTAPAIFLGEALARAPEEVAQHGLASGALLHTPARVLRGWLVCGSGAATVLMSWSGESYFDCAEAAAALISWRCFVVVFFAVWLNSLTLHVASQLLAAVVSTVMTFMYALFAAVSQDKKRFDVEGMTWYLSLLPLKAGVTSSVYIMAAMSALLTCISLAVVVIWFAEQDASAGQEGAGGRAYQPVAAAPGAEPLQAPLSSELDELLAPLMESDDGEDKAEGAGEEGDVEFGRLRQGGQASYVGPDGQDL